MAKRKSDQGKSNGEESIAGYFRKIFQGDPKLLKKRSNAVLLERWLADHPGYSEVPSSVKNSLANLKSVLRSRRRKRRRAAQQPAGAAAPQAPAARKSASRQLVDLETQIDDCLTFARTLDRDGLAGVIAHLRDARNAVVWKLGS